MVNKEIIDDWNDRFPILSPYTPSTLYMKADIVLWGLRIDRIFSKQYRIIFECLPLWEDSIQKRNIPVFHTELLGMDGTQFFIDYASRDRLFQSASDFTEKQFGLFVKAKVEVSDVWKWLDQLSSSFIPKHNPIKLYRIFEFKLALALFLDDVKLMDQAKKEIDTEIRHWDVLHFQKFFQNPPMNGEQNYMQSLKIGILLSGWSIPISMIKE
ncbi:MAG: hypothetical protein PUC79_00185 [Prevotellaceae bacterium]|nr:hypothetical protein [Prevotellaceae bacterium]